MQMASATDEEVANATKEYQRGVAMAAHTLSLHHLSANSSGQLSFQLSNSTGVANSAKQSFRGFYDSHWQGRGIWKWSNSLDAYQRHFAGWAGHQVNMAEVGVQSGGSVQMWQSVLGAKCHVYGLDINKNCMQFSNAQTTITIGDQADPKMWENFFANVAPKLDVLVDDGGHEPHQMRVTLVEVFNRLQPGGFIALEDIHGQHYVKTFFTPAANYLGYMAKNGQVASVHVYPFLLIVHKAGSSPLPAVNLYFDPQRVVVDNFAAMWEKLPQKRGGAVVLQNQGWGPFLTGPGLTNFFAHFGSLHDFNYYATPTGCEHTKAAVCSTTVWNSPTQALISGVHIYSNYLVAESPMSPPVISAVRRGTAWIDYR